MAYCTVEDLQLRFGQTELIQLTDKEGATGSVDTDVLAAAVADADAEIDGYLADGGYTVPLTSPPYRLKRHACSLARYFLYDDDRPDAVQAEYQRALNWLEGVASGKIKLGDETRDTTDTLTPPVANPRTMVYDDDWAETFEQ